ncbi:MAG TPA: hypothetical protein VII63_05435 [Caulobacteraceae bacterium]
MIGLITRGADRLDAWLHLHLGRTYTVILGAGLVFGIIASLRGLGQAMGSGTSVVRIVATVVFQLALLVNQLAQFHHYRQERRARRKGEA